MRLMMRTFGLAAILGAAAVPSEAANITFTGLVANLCVLTVTTPGTLGLAAGGTTLSSEEVGGLNATMTVTATGANPTIAFGAPALTGPSASTTGATKEISYSSPGGANQAYTTSSSNYVMNRLIDTLTVKGQATNSNGFVSGTYGVSATVTCQQ